MYYGYGKGDKSGTGSINQRFDAFYGFNQPWSRNDYISWDNVHAPKARLDIKLEPKTAPTPTRTATFSTSK